MAEEIRTSTLAASLAADAAREIAETETLASPVTEASDNTFTSDTSVNTNGQLETSNETNGTETVVETPAEIAPAEVVSDFFSPEGEVQTEATVEQPAQTITSWKDAIKAADRTEVLKELGLDDFDIKFSDFRKGGGDPYKYIYVNGVDYSKISDDVLVRELLKEEYPFLATDNEKLTKLINKRYSQDEMASDEDKELGDIQKQADAHKYRQKMIAEAANFKFPEIRQPEAAPQQTVDPKIQEETKRFTDSFNQHEATKNLINSKRVAIELGIDGVKPINYTVDPKVVWDSLFNPDSKYKFGRTKTGEPDVPLYLENALYRLNPSKFKKDIFNAGKEAALKGIVKDGQNAERPTVSKQVDSTQTLKEVFSDPSRIRTGNLASKI